MTPPAFRRPGVVRRVPVPIRIAGCAALAVAAGCDIAIPTEPPQIQTRWIVPTEETRFTVGELLPGDVTLTLDSSAFIVDFDAVTFAETLDELCLACAIGDGLTIPKPAFVGSFDSGVSFPDDVFSVEILDGTVELELFNGLNFDPIRPAPGETGSLTLTITDSADGDLLGSLVIDGATTAFPPGSTLLRTVDLAAASVEGGLAAEATVDSPLGDPVTMDASLPISVTATPTNVRVGSVSIDVASRSVDFDPVSLDVEDMDEELVRRLVEGAFILDVMNPFGVGATFQLRVEGPEIATIEKSASITTAASSRVVLGFTGDELKAFLGKSDVVLSGGAVIDASAGVITVAPGEELALRASFDLTLLFD